VIKGRTATTAVLLIVLFSFRHGASAETCSDPSTLEPGSATSIFIFDAGQADAMAVVCRDGRIGMLVDTGDPREKRGFAAVTSGLEELASRSPGGMGIGLLVLTHPDADHIGGGLWVLDRFKVGTIIDNGLPVDSRTYLNLRKRIKDLEKSGRVKYLAAGQTAERMEICREVEARVVTPKAWMEACTGVNECSVVLKVTAGRISFLLTGDAGGGQEEHLIKSAEAGLKSDVLKVGHHGSESSTSPKFLSAVDPACAVMSSGRPFEGSNKFYKHPRELIVRRLIDSARYNRHNRQATELKAWNKKGGAYKTYKHDKCLYSTASDGTVVFSTDGRSLACASDSGGRPR
jgi:beta-lactamase superfamily II metal-dependent hydrolase